MKLEFVISVKQLMWGLRIWCDLIHLQQTNTSEWETITGLNYKSFYVLGKITVMCFLERGKCVSDKFQCYAKAHVMLFKILLWVSSTVHLSCMNLGVTLQWLLLEKKICLCILPLTFTHSCGQMSVMSSQRVNGVWMLSQVASYQLSYSADIKQIII